MKTKDFSKFILKIKVLSTEERNEFPELPPEFNKNLFWALDNFEEKRNEGGIQEHLNSLNTGYQYDVKHLGEDYATVLYSVFEITREKIS